jgi:hypothetical protein
MASKLLIPLNFSLPFSKDGDGYSIGHTCWPSRGCGCWATCGKTGWQQGGHSSFSGAWENTRGPVAANPHTCHSVSAEFQISRYALLINMI